VHNGPAFRHRIVLPITPGDCAEFADICRNELVAHGRKVLADPERVRTGLNSNAGRIRFHQNDC
jgi:hypothetical protein